MGQTIQKQDEEEEKIFSAKQLSKWTEVQLHWGGACRKKIVYNFYFIHNILDCFFLGMGEVFFFLLLFSFLSYSSILTPNSYMKKKVAKREEKNGCCIVCQLKKILTKKIIISNRSRKKRKKRRAKRHVTNKLLWLGEWNSQIIAFFPSCCCCLHWHDKVDFILRNCYHLEPWVECFFFLTL